MKSVGGYHTLDHGNRLALAQKEERSAELPGWILLIDDSLWHPYESMPMRRGERLPQHNEHAGPKCVREMRSVLARRKPPRKRRSNKS